MVLFVSSCVHESLFSQHSISGTLRNCVLFILHTPACEQSKLCSTCKRMMLRTVSVSVYAVPKIGLANKFQVAALSSRSKVAKIPFLGPVLEKVIHVRPSGLLVGDHLCFLSSV